jgi:hypothetical protein
VSAFNHLPPHTVDDHAKHIDGEERSPDEVAIQMAGDVIARMAEWTTRGRGREKLRLIKLDLIILSIAPQLLPDEIRSLSAVARRWGISKQRASTLGIEFSGLFGGIQFRGQRHRIGPSRRKRARGLAQGK